MTKVVDSELKKTVLTLQKVTLEDLDERDVEVAGGDSWSQYSCGDCCPSNTCPTNYFCGC